MILGRVLCPVRVNPQSQQGTEEHHAAKNDGGTCLVHLEQL